MKYKQLFDKYDVVKIAKDREPCMPAHAFNEEAIVLSSYEDMGTKEYYDKEPEYQLFTRSQGFTAWYPQRLLIFRRRGDRDLLLKWTKEHEDLRKTNREKELNIIRDEILEWYKFKADCVHHDGKRCDLIEGCDVRMCPLYKNTPGENK